MTGPAVEVVSFKLPQGARAQLREHANAHGMTISTYIRAQLGLPTVDPAGPKRGANRSLPGEPPR